MRPRKNVAAMTSAERTAFADAVLEIRQRPSLRGLAHRYDDFARIHVDAMSVPFSWGHGGPAFTAWHRVLLAQFEQELRTVDDTVRIPFWDWTGRPQRHQPAVARGPARGRRRARRVRRAASRGRSPPVRSGTPPGTGRSRPEIRAPTTTRSTGRTSRAASADEPTPCSSAVGTQNDALNQTLLQRLRLRPGGAAAQPGAPVGHRADDPAGVSARSGVLAAPLQHRPAVGDLDARRARTPTATPRRRPPRPSTSRPGR